MFGRKNKGLPEQGRARQPRYSGERPASPAFSYYTNRSPDAPSARVATRQNFENEAGKGARGAHIPWGQLPFWLFVAIAVVCAGKLLFLSTNPKVIILNKNAITSTYLRPNATYASAAHHLLAGSITNRTKLTVNLAGTSYSLQKQFPELQTVSITMPLIGNRPLVYVEAAQPSLILQTTHGNFAMSRSGVLLARLTSIPANVPTVNDQSTAGPRSGTQFLPASTVDFILTTDYQFNAAHIAVATYVLPSASPYELDMRPEGKSFVIKYNLEEDALEQSGAAIATIQHLGTTVPPSYIDVRAPGRVYYK
jgi:hypothetical protein